MEELLLATAAMYAKLLNDCNGLRYWLIPKRFLGALLNHVAKSRTKNKDLNQHSVCAFDSIPASPRLSLSH